MEIKVFAKINYILNIIGREGDYHTLDMVESNISLYDIVNIEKNNTNNCTINLTSQISSIKKEQYIATIQKILSKLLKNYSRAGLDIQIKKNIPLGAGLGGGSAPIVGIIKGIEQILGIKVDGDTLLSLGSDIPYMYEGGWARVSHLGEKIKKLDGPKLDLIIALPNLGINTKECYNKFDKICISPIYKQKEIDLICKDIQNIPQYTLFNDLETPAILLNEEIENVFSTMRKHDLDPHMSGSGSAVFAIFNGNYEKDIQEQLKNCGYTTFIVSTF